jgi:hypothetical protein
VKKVNIELENCYGIRKLIKNFDFTQKSTYAIYSPNGTMKTSLAKTFSDLSQNRETTDLIFTERDTKRFILDEDGKVLLPEQVFVIEPYNEIFKSDKLSTLLVNKTLKDQYESIHKNITNKKDILVKGLKPLTGLKKDIEELFSIAFTHSPKGFYKALSRVKSEVLDGDASEFGNIVYGKIFSDKTTSFLETKDFKDKLLDYINKYDVLIGSSTYFKKGVFNHNNASVIAKNLKDNGFFEAQHSVHLNSGSNIRKITTQEELEVVITEEKDSILNNPELAKAFDEIDTKLKANKELRDFRDYLLENLGILPELSNLDAFKQKLWVSYLKILTTSYEELVDEYTKGREELEGIVSQAQKEETNWRTVIDIFNKRFDVPFELSVENQDDVILKSAGPNIKFIFKEGSQEKAINESELLKILSNGEKRALYILNIIFEVEARKNSSQETLFIIDDIADSFDYKNKYAIIEYLRDISIYSGFNQIILSHNFDFFRTVCSRLDMGRQQKLHTIKSNEEVKLVEEKYQNNPFIEWKKNLASDNAMLIASIPFVRNVAEYSGDDDGYKKLTSLLHHKSDTPDIKISDLENIHKNILRDQDDLTLPNGDKSVLTLIFEEADKISALSEEIIDLEGKIVLSLAIRLKAESYMILEISDPDFVNNITSTQTYALYKKYIELFEDKTHEIELFNKVNLMTPENIHLNSFMYEPILDMSNVALINLYEDIKNLFENNEEAGS